MLNRRRFLSILAAAPFMPYEEVLREVVKPKIFALGGFDEVSLQAIELEVWAKEIPDLIYRRTSLYDRMARNVEISRFREARANFFRVPMGVTA